MTATVTIAEKNEAPGKEAQAPLADHQNAARPAKKPLANLIPDAVTVTLVSAAAYLGCYLHEIAYASYFGIPREFITVSVSSLLVFGGTVACMVLVGWQILDLVVTVSREGLLPPKGSALALLARKWGVLAAIAAVLWAISGYELNKIWRFWFLIIFISLDLLSPLVMRKKGEPYGIALKNWLLLDHGEERKARSAAFLHSPTFKGMCNIVVLLGLGITLCMAIGYGDARRRERFGCMGNEVLLARYGDNLVLCGYDPATNTLLREYRCLPLSAAGKISSRRLANVKVQDE